jgi:hypothetical protein
MIGEVLWSLSGGEVIIKNKENGIINYPRGAFK